MADRLASLAQLGCAEEMVDAAQYLEKLPGYEHHAILLYDKACRLTVPVVDPVMLILVLVLKDSLRTKFKSLSLQV